MGGAGKSRDELLAEVEVLRRRIDELSVEYGTGLRLLLEQLPVVLWATDADFRCTYAAGGALKHLGLEPRDVVGMSLYGYFQTTDAKFPAIGAHHRAVSGHAESYEVTFGGVTAECHVEPRYDGEGETVGVIGIALDITARARAEADRERLMGELRDALASQRPLGDLVRICAHCNFIQESSGRWVPLVRFLADRTDARFSHGVCPSCVPSARQS